MFTGRGDRLRCGLTACLLGVALFLSPGGVAGQDQQLLSPTGSTPTQTAPPGLAQALIPEGEFAVQLAEALKLASGSDQTRAEERLSEAGIEPRNGWISDFPVTPEVLGEITKDVTAAAEYTRIGLNKEDALKALTDVEARMQLDVNLQPTRPDGLYNKPANTTIYGYTDEHGVSHYTDRLESIPEEFRKQAKIVRQASPSRAKVSPTAEETVPSGPQYPAAPEAISGYYSDQGPPIVTYYVPPAPYYYLYSWNPYPFWSSGFYFPGFFILNNFHRHVFFRDHRFTIAHHGGFGSFRGGVDRPFANTPAPVGHTPMDAMSPPRPFNSPSVQSSARAIMAIQQNRINLNNAGAPLRTTTPAPVFGQPGGATGTMRQIQTVPNRAAGAFQGSFPPSQAFRGRTFAPPAIPQRHFVPPMQRYYAPGPAPFPAFRGSTPFGGAPMGAFHGSGSSFGGFHGGFGGAGRH